MVLLIPLIASIPTVIGVSEAVASQRRANDEASTSGSTKDEKAQMRKFVLECYCAGGKGRRAKELHGGKVVLGGGKLWIQPPPKSKPTNQNPPSSSPSSQTHPHPFRGFYLPYPDPARGNHPQLGLVSFIGDSPPTLNWIYVDRETREVRYGNRTQSIKHVVGEWGWDLGEGDEEEGGEEEGGGVTLNGEEGAVVKFREKDGEDEGGWEVLWEGEGDGEGGVGKGGLRVSLERRWVDDGEGKGEGGGGKKEEEEKEKEKEKEKEGKFNVRTFNATATSSKGKKRRVPDGGGG